ncbi:MAG: TRAP transporter small permease [Xanthobacteraceae bacterium]|jgi:TRAP-type C4-dicarboxylate transport system permease small subunit
MDSNQQSTPLIGRLQRAQFRLAATALLVMMMGTVIDVFFRYAFNMPLRISYDLVESMLVIYVFNGMAGAFLRRRNIVIDIIDTLVSARVIRALIVIADLLSVLCLAIFAYAMIRPGLQAYDYGDHKLELGLPLYVLWIFAFAGICGTILCAVAALIGHLRARNRMTP